MSANTACTIECRDANASFCILRSHFGQPRGGKIGVLETLKLALPYTWPIPRFEPDDFAAAIIRAWKTPFNNEFAASWGRFIYFSHGRDNHNLTDYHYIITKNKGIEGGLLVTVEKRQNDWSWRTSPIKQILTEQDSAEAEAAIAAGEDGHISPRRALDLFMGRTTPRKDSK